MNLKQLRPLLEIAILSVVTFAGHTLYFSFFKQDINRHFHYSLIVLYGFFFGCSLVITSILIKIKHKNIDSVGNAFMLLTCIKMVLAYALLQPILNAQHQNAVAEKTNFFVVFALFLTFETIVAIRLLNKN